jgi:N-acyl-D-amino-acid deacylase
MKTKTVRNLLALFFLMAPATERLLGEDADRYDLVLRKGIIHVGDGKPGFQGDIAIRDGRIVAIETEITKPSDRILACDGLVVCPGFIDLHTHSDDPIVQRDTRANVNYLLQGCTTSVTGNCGFGPTDVAKYLGDIDRDGAGTNVIHLLPHGNLREKVMGKVNRLPTDSELEKMREIADKAMVDGAFGMSTGLIYIPGTFSKTEELIEVAKVIARHKGIYASHIRNEGLQLIDSIQEIARIGSEGGLPVHVSHFKASGTPSWGTLHVAAALIDKMRGEGVAITADQYPYSASSTSLEATLLPSWAREGGREALQKRLEDPATAEKIRDAIITTLKSTYRIQLATCKLRPDWIGMNLDQIAAKEKSEVADIVIKIEKSGGAAVVNFGMDENDVRMAMKFPWLATASDGGAKVPTSSQPHPRSFGTFPRKIGRYAIEEGVLTMESAIRSATSLPADILGLTDRGRLTDQSIADVVVFDPTTFRDQATYDQPYLTPTGIKHVIVNGALAVYEGQATGALAGRAIRKTKQVSDAQSASKAKVDPAWSVEKLVALINPKSSKTSPDKSSPEAPFASIDFQAYAGDRSELPIGVFDSGIGGLTVLEAILASDLHDNKSGKPGADGIPDFQSERFIYLGDQANMPYGNYPERGREDYLRELIFKDSIFLLGNRYWASRDASEPSFDKLPVKAIVIACNTATAFGLEDLRKALDRWQLPLITVGVVEAGATAIMDQVQDSETPGAVAVLATMGTCNSGAYPRAISQTAGRRGQLVPKVTQQGSLGLAGAIEGDPAFVANNARAAEGAAAIQYRGPALGRSEAPINPKLIPSYGFEMSQILGNPNSISSWKLNSIENYVRYDVATLVENYRKSTVGTPIPIKYILLGCTHFPFEARRIENAFSRLRSYQDSTGVFPYQAWIAEQLQIVNPAELTAKDLFRQLFLQRLRAKSNSIDSLSQHQIYLSVPNQSQILEKNLEQGWLSFDFKYGRSAGEYTIESTRYVPLRPDLLPDSSVGLLKSYAPNVSRMIGLSGLDKL